MAQLPLIPSAVIGSHGKPGWWFATVKKVEAGEYGPGDLDEMFDDAADTAIRDMERAGLDIITDGEVRRLDGYVDSYYTIIKGISPLPVRRKAGPWGYDQQTRYEAVGRIETPEGGLGIVKEFEYLKAHTSKATKATCAGPLTFGSRIHPGTRYKGVVDVAERFAEVINEELKGLVAAGADFIQLDEPARGNVSGEEMARLFNLATDGVKAKLGFHICFGNRFGRSRFDRTYRPYFPGILKARADQLVLEFAGREFSELDLWKEYGQDRELGAGVIDVKGFYPESPEDVAKRIKRVLAVCKPEKLYVNPDCGFGWSPRYMCNQKVRALAAGAVLARQELQGDEVGAMSVAYAWGTEEAERRLPFACDGYVSRPDAVYFRGVTVDAPPARLFHWLCQLRVAPYSYDWIDNGGRRSPRELTPATEQLAIGQSMMRIFTIVDFMKDRHITSASSTAQVPSASSAIWP